MVAVVLSQAKKSVSSRAGMKRSALTSPMYPAWVESADQDLRDARQAIGARDLDALGEIMERSALKMHATMMTSQPSLRYWKSGSVWAMDAVESLRSQGVSAWWTMDAGPNVKILCRREDANLIAQRMERVAPAVHVLQIGGAPRLLPE